MNFVTLLVGIEAVPRGVFIRFSPVVLEVNTAFHVIPTMFLNDFSVRVTQTGCELLTGVFEELFIADD